MMSSYNLAFHLSHFQSILHSQIYLAAKSMNLLCYFARPSAGKKRYGRFNADLMRYYLLQEEKIPVLMDLITVIHTSDRASDFTTLWKHLEGIVFV